MMLHPFFLCTIIMDTKEIIYAAACAAIVLGLIWFKRDVFFFRWRASQAEGTIKNWMAATEKGIRYFYPVIEFTLKNGATKSFRADDRCENEPMYAPGTKVIVRYLEKNPDEVKVIFPQKNS